MGIPAVGVPAEDGGAKDDHGDCGIGEGNTQQTPKRNEIKIYVI